MAYTDVDYKVVHLTLILLTSVTLIKLISFKNRTISLLAKVCGSHELGVWGTHFSDGNLKSWNTRSWVQNPSLLREKLAIAYPVWGGGLWREWISVFPTHFNVGVFLIYPMCRSCSLVSRFILERIVPYVAVDFVCPGEKRSSGAAYFAMLDWKSPLFIS